MQTLRHITFTEKQKTNTATKKICIKSKIYTNTNEFRGRGKKFKILNSPKNKISLYPHKIKHFCVTHKQKKGNLNTFAYHYQKDYS